MAAFNVRGINAVIELVIVILLILAFVGVANVAEVVGGIAAAVVVWRVNQYIKAQREAKKHPPSPRTYPPPPPPRSDQYLPPQEQARYHPPR
ncbi:MAG: hypothetical protein DLM58_01970 [Pseudonocardiales bacterium]|nr:hypothetical protein [Candidatus Dormibacteraeota bacterium]PZS36349.1 MAG: hypothetical protein DLM58_01970 [Pseudonocardiales bacterium]